MSQMNRALQQKQEYTYKLKIIHPIIFRQNCLPQALDILLLNIKISLEHIYIVKPDCLKILYFVKIELLPFLV